MENTEDNVNNDSEITAEGNIITDDEMTSTEPLVINAEIKEYLSEVANWAKFLAILGFVGIGMMGIFAIIIVLAGFAYDNYTRGSISPTWMALIYILMGVLYFFPINYLFNFSNSIKKGIQLNDSEVLTTGFENLKSHYKFMGIFTIIVISIYTVLLSIALLIIVFK